jgi:hypothetical protein
VRALSTSQLRGALGVPCLAVDDGSAAGIGSPRVPAHCLVFGLLLGNCSLVPLVVRHSRTRASFVAASCSSCSLYPQVGCPSFFAYVFTQSRFAVGTFGQGISPCFPLLAKPCHCPSGRATYAACSGCVLGLGWVSTTRGVAGWEPASPFVGPAG